MPRKDTQTSKKKPAKKLFDAHAVAAGESQESDANSKAFNCSYCGEKFHNKGGLLNHLRVVHYRSEQRTKPETRKSHSARPLGLHSTPKAATNKQEDWGHSRPSPRTAKVHKKSKPPCKAIPRGQKPSDGRLGKRDAWLFAAEDSLKIDEQCSDHTATGDAAHLFKRKSGETAWPQHSDADKAARTRAASNSRKLMLLTKTEDSCKTQASSTIKPLLATNSAVKRGRPRKNRPDSTEQGPANWKWRSNLCIQLKKIEPVECSYRECKTVVSSRKEWASHMLQHLLIPTFSCSLCSRTFFNEDCFRKDQLRHLQLAPKLEPQPEKEDLSPNRHYFETDDFAEKREQPDSSDQDVGDDL